MVKRLKEIKYDYGGFVIELIADYEQTIKKYEGTEFVSNNGNRILVKPDGSIEPLNRQINIVEDYFKINKLVPVNNIEDISKDDTLNELFVVRYIGNTEHHLTLFKNTSVNEIIKEYNKPPAEYEEMKKIYIYVRDDDEQDQVDNLKLINITVF
ncbi:hypothetical protein [Staphylococcus pettenkoferi]|uniref:hypothetical protein n=1 Tax=Staphylococcus pettenkoferi TaxID=170573 RepID=UPI0011A370AD|nr:hypothetical protein [Staphylococcus pettenkoferi]